MLLRIASILFPVFAIVGVGYLYALRHKPDMLVANRLTMDVFVPALVFAALAGKSYSIDSYVGLALATLVMVVGSGLVAWPVARAMGIAPKTFVPPMMFNNSGNLGLPLAVLAFGDAALAPAIVMFLVSNLMHFSFGAWLLDHGVRLTTMWRIPVVQATIAGLAVSFLEIPIWEPLLIGIRMLGDIAIPLLLFALGVRLTDVRLNDWQHAIAGAVVRPVIGMAICWGMGVALGLDAAQQGMLLVFGALPPAVLNYVFAERYQQEPEKVASLVLIGNLAALLFLPIALALALE
ncbi:MAG: AEC family transporter [Chromatiales bacterium]|nr:AEC family transporter [Chromatiales bacterium]